MKGIVCNRIGEFQYREDLPEPQLLDGEAIIRIKRIGICGTDLHAFRGNQPFFTYPRILGHELSGVIEKVGVNDEGLKVGDTVCVIPYIHCGECWSCLRGKTNCCRSMKVIGVHLDGGMRERISVPISHLMRTEGLSLDQAALIEPLAIGTHGVKRANVTSKDTVLVIGAGPIGLGIMVCAKAMGATLIAMDTNVDRLAFCKDWAKVDHTIQVGEELSDLSALTGGEFPSIVLDATGNQESMTNAFHMVAHGGTLVYVGLIQGEISFRDSEFHKRELTLMGSRNATKDDFNEVMKRISDGGLDVEPYITHRCRFEELIREFQGWMHPSAKVIKAMVEL
ncbi:Alcohol dehydrogenase GroES domain protein [Paenibacillus vortex V453]|uniref:Alcohol dehydrogenase GroES domain protein n=1 Tax=Paenibacillus vortex V453 TaxID=715225 RepID=A0A2R9SP38_9BACL|nr:zinc-binding alcohol dehydrogenase family protein [Paenibacillus vortex]EFU39113.1 Alcohol dehydrogenase GroES domain protein [Paenibacillus vortex V453]